MIRTLTLFFSFTLFFVSFVAPAWAQNEAGIGIQPAIIEESMDPGEVRDFSITVSNLSSQEQLYYVYGRDIIGVRTGGVPIFAEEERERTGFELSEWIGLAVSEITLPANGQQVVDFTLTVPESASPGSHFGALFISREPPRLRRTGASVGYDVANIITIRVAGDALEQAQIRQFSTSNYIYGSPNVEFDIRLENSGNTLIRPVGPLEVYNMFGRQVAVMQFNDTLAGVFPQTTREFKMTWTDEGTGFGRYEAILSTSYGDTGAKKSMSSTVTFWILPMNIILPALGILAFILLTTYFGVKWYVRRVVAQYGVTRRIVRSRGRRGTPTGLLIVIVMLAVTALFLLILLVLFA